MWDWAPIGLAYCPVTVAGQLCNPRSVRHRGTAPVYRFTFSFTARRRTKAGFPSGLRPFPVPSRSPHRPEVDPPASTAPVTGRLSTRWDRGGTPAFPPAVSAAARLASCRKGASETGFKVAVPCFSGTSRQTRQMCYRLEISRRTCPCSLTSRSRWGATATRRSKHRAGCRARGTRSSASRSA